ncbi:type II toxin-antitoxin system RatA family toxin [Xenophilus arseniciresistens]|uniref:Type II toxin-antitoxin system RatA family toxin n=1 Tax=Xenophilus arseniciresistens TaxID=1283306 RepID=A0AAE3T1M5_9BURK|nr:type II toxin-antitoxin system RatA family toxin [Xenophilus arseniciresistens]MDA7418131.1 type II toxin-antitoxin system RatA family toxin [Xenophilus arseniciresistens]
MKSVHKSVLIWYSAQQMYALVTDVAKYPEFLPWCDQARVIEEDTTGMTAEVGLAFGAVRQSFTTRNTHVPGREVHMKLVKGPFSHLDGVWTFTPVGEEGAEITACRIELKLNYGFDNFALQALVGPVFDKVASTLVEAFVKRSEQVYGEP